MFGTMQRRWEMRRLMSRLESARVRKEMAMEAFVSGNADTPILAPGAGWSMRVTERPDAGHVADVIEECEMLEARLQYVIGEVERLEEAI